MENFHHEIYGEDELCVDIVVPRYWNDAEYWNDGDPLPDTLSVRGRFRSPYSRLRLGIPGQDAEAPEIRILSVSIPFAREGDSVVVFRETIQADGTVAIAEENYAVATVMADGLGVTTCTLYAE